LRLLIDESLPRSLAAKLTGHDVSTVHDQGWLGLRNGVLLRATVGAGFNVLITADHSLPYQQNLRKIGISVLVLTGVRSRIEDIRFLVTQISSVLPMLKPGDALEIGPLKGDVICDRPIADQLLATAAATRGFT